MLDDIILLKDLTDHERLMFQNEYFAVRKSGTTGVLLALFLGLFGAHHFYMGRVGLGVLYLLFCWTYLPFVVGLVECFLMSGRVETFNREKAEYIVTKLKALRPSAA
ncbi:MAG TPA: NINE protein [Pirellulales bacterium]|nr:NINE protein [Pirellulales bacterium]